MQFNDRRMQEYFDTLPSYVQESIMQSGINFTSKGKMRKFVRNLHKPG